jgi:hypothetical protein
MAGFYANFAGKLIDMGWPAALPLHGKQPYIQRWSRYNEEAMAEDVLDRLVQVYPDANIGLPMGHGVCAVDLDVTEPDKARQVVELADAILGPTPLIRIGQAPKQARFYQGTVRSRKEHPFEIFGNSGQVVIYGIHPGTGRLYTWPLSEPLDTSPRDLPTIDDRMVEEFLRHAASVVMGPIRTAGGGPLPLDAQTMDLFDRLRAARKGKRGRRRIKTLARQLRNAEPGQLHNVMISVSAAMVADGYSDRAILAFFDEHFSAPRQGEYAAVWKQIPSAISGARIRYGVPVHTTVPVLSDLLGTGGVR